VAAPLAVYRMTSEMVGGVWPLIAADGLPPTGALMGLDLLSGEAFYADPIGWTIDGMPASRTRTSWSSGRRTKASPAPSRSSACGR